MNKEEILKKAQLEKQDEQKSAISNFSLGTMGVFLFIGLCVLLLIKIWLKTAYFDVLGLLICALGAYAYGYYVQIPKAKDTPYKLFSISKMNYFLWAGSILMAIGVSFISAYIKELR